MAATLMKASFSPSTGRRCRQADEGRAPALKPGSETLQKRGGWEGSAKRPRPSTSSG